MVTSLMKYTDMIWKYQFFLCETPNGDAIGMMRRAISIVQACAFA
jgi:hypothetical protein